MSEKNPKTGPLYNREWRDQEKNYKKKDYVPLTERDDWDGEVEVIPSFEYLPRW